MLKYLLLGMSVMIIAVPARAQTVALSCRMTASEQQAFAAIGYASNGLQVMHLSVDKPAGKVTVWETSPEFPDVDKSTYDAKFAGVTAAWAIGDIADGPQAHDSVDLTANVLTTVDPTGDATQWNCSAG